MSEHTHPIPTELARAHVAGSGRIHYVIVGEHLTLCGRIATYRNRWQPLTVYCQRCTIEASRRGWTTRP